MVGTVHCKRAPWAAMQRSGETLTRLSSACSQEDGLTNEEAANEPGHDACSLTPIWSRTTYCTGGAELPLCATKSRDGVKITAADWRSSLSRRVCGSGSSASSKW